MKLHHEGKGEPRVFGSVTAPGKRAAIDRDREGRREITWGLIIYHAHDWPEPAVEGYFRRRQIWAVLQVLQNSPMPRAASEVTDHIIPGAQRSRGVCIIEGNIPNFFTPLVSTLEILRGLFLQ